MPVPGTYHALSKWWLSLLLEQHEKRLALGSILGQQGEVAQETWALATEITVTSTCRRQTTTGTADWENHMLSFGLFT